jgi:nonribosomal peptide synthetase DhbF
MVVAHLADPPPMMRTPVTEVFFNLIDRAPIHRPQDQADAIRSDRIEVHNGLARFDLLATLYRDGPDCSLSLAVRDETGQEPAEPMLRAFFAHAERHLQGAKPGRAHPPVQPTDPESKARRTGAATPEPGTPETHVLYTVLGVFREVLGEPSLAATDDFFRHGGNSLKAVRALSMLRDRLGVEVSTVIIFSEPTPERLSRALLSGSFHPADSPMYRMSPGPEHHALHLIPGIEGNLISFGPLVRRIGAERACIGLEYPGLHAASEPLPSIGAISAYFRDLLRTAGSHGAAPPLVGYSFGGVVAFDMAVAYQRQGLKPGPLVLIDSYLPERVEKKSRAQRMRIYARAAIGLPTPDRIRFVRRRVRGFLQRRRQAREEIERRSGPLFEANIAALDTYRATDAYAGPVLIVRGRRPDWMRTQRDDGRNGWSAKVSGPISVAEIPAEHSELLREQHADEVAARIAEWLRSFDPGHA